MRDAVVKSKQGKFSLESGLARLEEIAKTLEEGTCPLDDSVALFEEGASLYKQCKEALQSLQLKIEKITYSVEENE